MKKMGKRICMAVLVLLLVSLLLPVFSGSTVEAKTGVGVSKVTVTRPGGKSLTLNVGKTYQLNVKVSPSNAANKKVSYKSSNNKVVSVSASGKLKAKKSGNAQITVTAADGSGKKAVLKVKAVISVNKVTIISPAVKQLVLVKGKTDCLKTKVTPTNAGNKQLSFSSSDSKIVTVSSKGKITAKKSGTVTITAKAKDGSGKKAVLKVTVGTPVTEVRVSPAKITKFAGSTYTVTAKVAPDKASVKTLTYSSSNTDLATVNGNGKVTLKKAGTVKITATATDGSGKKGVISIQITTPVRSIVLDQTNVTGETGGTYQMNATVHPETATNKKLSYSSSNQTLATVDGNGKVTLLKAGTVKITAAATDGSGITAVCSLTIKDPAIPQTDAYSLVWQDEFNGTELNSADWNYELHEPGWVNNELQKYTDSTDNIFVQDGNLVIKAKKTEDENGTSYTSGRINTQGKHDFKYGRFEIRAKVTGGQGFLPAFWMMPTDESLYGQWPKCGEIDIMEVLGNQTDKVYGTLHFGEPHTQRQGSNTLSGGTYSDGYHTYACEWEPGEIRFYVDDKLYYTANDWFTKKSGYGEVTYPAPFDQPFYMILNLAVGGDWPGNPDETTTFGENAELKVDYVRVYQKDSYDEDVTKPVTNLTFRDPDETGNYVLNGDFSTIENLSDENSWEFLLAGTGAANAEISDNALHIQTSDPGKLDYSVQVVQADLPMEKGYKYRLTFDASASEERTMITDVSAPDKDYIRYLADTSVQLTKETQSYSYEFDITKESDTNGRLEFNLGNQNSSAAVTIRNVRIEKIGTVEIPEEVKDVLPDGNYVYNGEFQEGSDRMNDWSVENSCHAVVAVTNQNNIRELKAVVPAGVTDLKQLILKQEQIAVIGGKTYVLSFDAYGDSGQKVEAVIAGQTFDAVLTPEKTTYKYTFSTDSETTGAVLQFLLGTTGTAYLDNVRIQEEGMLINGDFSNGMTGYEVFADSSVANGVSYGVDGLTENNAASFTIGNTGDADWKIQLLQRHIHLENGKWYKISLDAKSTQDRVIMYALQRDGAQDNDWTPYSGTQVIGLTGEYQTFSTVFQMTGKTDSETILSISMGSVNGVQIAQPHTICIDNLKLEEVEEPQTEDVAAGTELIQNGDFSQGAANWINAITAPGVAEADFSQGKAIYTIVEPGTADWNIQLKQSGLHLETGASYRVRLKLKSSKDRSVRLAFLNASYQWYGGMDIDLTAGEETEIDEIIPISAVSDAAIDFMISMGKMENADTPASTIEISGVSVVKQ